MIDKNKQPSQVALTENDIQEIDQFRRKKSTAVLTILFTDIKGFTKHTEEHGEAYSNKIRHNHDNIIVPIIEREGSGRVIKHIGDAIMAVFSEPSTGVMRALEAQESLKKFNNENPDMIDIEVRMGLHTGQVTTENNVSSDIFGRHVNRAARVEALADSGQVLVTYPVFDSAHGWLKNKSDMPVEWKKHGMYALKGISEPIEIYEPYNPNTTQPKEPPGQIKPAGSSSFKLVAAVALVMVLLGVCGTFLYNNFANRPPPEITLVDYNTDWAILSTGEAFHVGGEPGDHIRTALTPLDEGKHLLYIDRSYLVRFFAPFEVKSGENLLSIQFERTQLPGISRRVEYEDGEKDIVTISRDFDFISYDKDMNRKEHKAHIDYTATADQDSEDENIIHFSCEWKIVLDGEIISEGRIDDTHDRNISEVTRKPQQILWSDDYHYYYLSYYMSGIGAEFTIQSSFEDYKDR